MILNEITVTLLFLYVLSSIIIGIWSLKIGYINQMELSKQHTDRLNSYLSTQLDITNRYLEEVNAVVGAADIYLLNN